MKTRFVVVLVLGAVLAGLAAVVPDRDFVAHEWGTFTSVQGADGVQMMWNPPVVSDLPSFVFERNRLSGFKNQPLLSAKLNLPCRQRMETPVIYFYSDRQRRVNVDVDFPQGTITEWYPLKSAVDLGQSPTQPTRKRPALRWEGIQLTPQASEQFLGDASGSHYYAARETDATPLQVPTGSGKFESEKFLFYRGTGSFEAPLTVRLDGADASHISLTNSGKEELRNLFIYEVRETDGVWLSLEKLTPGETKMVQLEIEKGARAFTAADRSLEKADRVSSLRMNTALVDALVREGLYPREARAMVKTWEDSWFSEKGLRVLYTLPRAWTDRTLPLEVTPSPREVARVMVGRADAWAQQKLRPPRRPPA